MDVCCAYLPQHLQGTYFIFRNREGALSMPRCLYMAKEYRIPKGFNYGLIYLSR
jgi:hypothetical protein